MGRQAQVMNHHISTRGRILLSTVCSCEEIIHTSIRCDRGLHRIDSDRFRRCEQRCEYGDPDALYALYVLYGTYIIAFDHNFYRLQIHSHHCSHRFTQQAQLSWKSINTPHKQFLLPMVPGVRMKRSQAPSSSFCRT